MYFSIRYKLFITLLLIISLVVAGMTLFMTWSLEGIFVRFIDTRQQWRIDGIEERLTKEYVDGGGWHRLDESETRWLHLLMGDVDEMPQHRPPQSELTTTGSVYNDPQRNPLFITGAGGRHTFLPVERRVMLLDADKSIIFGQPALAGHLTLRPIVIDQHTVGYLGVLPGPTLLHLSGEYFLEKQYEAFILIALIVMLASAIVVFPLSKRLMQPLRAFTEASRALAAGQYGTRIPVTSRDELGRLAEDFNRLAQALENNEVSRRQWVADISHELRTPLAVLRGEIEALQDGIRTLDQKAVNSLHGETLHLGRLVDDLYELSMSDAGSLNYHKTMLNPVPILQDTLESYEAEFGNQGIKVALEDQLAEQAVISADADRLAQLFDNLLSNTLRYTDAGGSLSVKIGRDPQSLLLDFMDSAPGVSDEDLPRLFDRLFRADSSRNRAHGGAGLGLAICRNIVQAHDGTISAQHSALGGIWIRVTLPLLK